MRETRLGAQDRENEREQVPGRHRESLREKDRWRDGVQMPRATEREKI